MSQIVSFSFPSNVLSDSGQHKHVHIFFKEVHLAWYHIFTAKWYNHNLYNGVEPFCLENGDFSLKCPTNHVLVIEVFAHKVVKNGPCPTILNGAKNNITYTACMNTETSHT